MKEDFNNYKATDFGANAENAAVEANEAAGTPTANSIVESHEAPKAESVFARGEARFQKAGEKISGLKDRLGKFFSSLGRKAAVGVLSAPELVRAGAARAQEAGTATLNAAEAPAQSFLNSWNKVNQAMEAGTNKVLDTALDAPKNLKAFGEDLKSQIGASIAEKANDVRAVGELASNFTSEKAAAARAGIENGMRSMRSYGERSLAFANARRIEAINDFKGKLNDMRIAQLSPEHRAQIANKEAMRKLFAQEPITEESREFKMAA